MSIAIVAARLVLIQEGIDGIRQAYTPSTMPNSLSSLRLPAVVNFAGPATYGWGVAGDIIETRIWTMRLYVTPAQRPIDAAKKAAKVEPFFRRFVIAFADAQQLDDLGDVQWAWIGEDGGTMSLEYGDDWFVGTEFTLQVKEQWNTAVST